jgi:hypothetical protein
MAGKREPILPHKFSRAPSPYAMAKKPDYYLATSETGCRPNPWRWEIRRYSRPMGIKIGEGGYRSQQAAEFAGKRAFKAFLERLAAEETRDSRPSN